MGPADVANLALSALGQGKEIQNLETENTAEARAIRRVYDDCVEKTFRDFPWPFATRIGALELVEENPNREWSFSYRKPSGTVFFRRILSGSRNDSSTSAVAFRIISDANGDLILTDMEEAEGEWTYLIDSVDKWPADFRAAVAYRIAAEVAPRITAGDPFKLGQRAISFYNAELSKAQANAGNEERPDLPPETDLVRARD